MFIRHFSFFFIQFKFHSVYIPYFRTSYSVKYQKNVPYFSSYSVNQNIVFHPIPFSSYILYFYHLNLNFY